MMDKRDMISSLPVSVIHIIVSFLTAQEAVRTCILSKTWKNLWTTLPFLDFDLGKFECDTELYRDKFESFRDFTSTTLLRREKSDLHTFRLSCKCGNWDDDMFIRSWIHYALKHNLQVLNINHLRLDDSSLNVSVFTCVSLVDVSINDPTDDELYDIIVINLPRLRLSKVNLVSCDKMPIFKTCSGCT